jgi:hypothetical protein
LWQSWIERTVLLLCPRGTKEGCILVVFVVVAVVLVGGGRSGDGGRYKTNGVHSGIVNKRPNKALSDSIDDFMSFIVRLPFFFIIPWNEKPLSMCESDDVEAENSFESWRADQESLRRAAAAAKDIQ